MNEQNPLSARADETGKSKGRQTRPIVSRTDRTLGRLLHDVRRYYRRAFDRRTSGLGLTATQWHVLAFLSVHEGLKQGELADELGMAPIALVRVIDHLEGVNLVERRVHPDDRRARTLHLKPAAASVIDRIQRVALDIQHQATAGFSREEFELFQRFLETVHRNLLADDDVVEQPNGEAAPSRQRGAK